MLDGDAALVVAASVRTIPLAFRTGHVVVGFVGFGNVRGTTIASSFARSFACTCTSRAFLVVVVRQQDIAEVLNTSRHGIVGTVQECAI